MYSSYEYEFSIVEPSVISIACMFTVQIENLLISTRGQMKLCDFGSATAQSQEPDHTWSAMKRSLVEDEVLIYCCFTINEMYVDGAIVFSYVAYLN